MDGSNPFYSHVNVFAQASSTAHRRTPSISLICAKQNVFGCEMNWVSQPGVAAVTQAGSARSPCVSPQ